MPPASIPAAHADLQRLLNTELHALADGLLSGEQWSIDRCVEFVVAESHGYWHGRARAMMCRRLKHCRLGRTQRTQLVEAIVGRLLAGNFSEQFKDQLRLALRLDATRTLAAAHEALGSSRCHVARYARWVLAHRLPRAD
ncbi:MAG TPA: hypothetical protein VF096_00685 [Azonexus sp.]